MYSKTKLSNILVVTEYQSSDQLSEGSSSKFEKGKYAAITNYSNH